MTDARLAGMGALDAPSVRRRLAGERGERRNCIAPRCGSILYLPSDVPDGYGSDLDYTFECPKCRSVYAAESASPSEVSFELAVIQAEFSAGGPRKAKREPRESVYRDPNYGPIKRAQDRIDDAERALDAAVLDAHEAGESVRKIALNAGESKSRIHDIIQRERERRGQRRAACAPVAVASVAQYDDIPF